MRGSVLFVVMGVIGWSAPAWSQGYSMDRSEKRIVIRNRAHWITWTFPSDGIEITEDGTVRPAYVRKNVNAALNARDFAQEDVSRAGSNPRSADRIVDGNARTFWEPDPDDPLRDWWVEIDLGRLVAATRIVVRFVEEGEGDPFKQFKVATSDGSPAFRGSEVLSFRVVGKTERVNRSQRVFEFPLEPVSHADWDGDGWADLTGEEVRYVRIVVTDSDFDRSKRVSKEEYEALDPVARGAVEYYRKTLSGQERLISRGGYEALEPERRGSIVYYRRERPRLAEVEVWSVGDNIALGLKARGGSIQAIGGIGAVGGAFDGDVTNGALLYAYNPFRRERDFLVDLGAWFWVDTIRITTGLEWGGVYWERLLGYEIRGSDGSRAPDGTLVWELLSSPARRENRNLALYVEDRFEPVPIRFLNLRHIVHLTGNWQDVRALIAEMQIYGEGYLPRVEMTSPLINLGGSWNLVSLAWKADTPPGTAVEIQTRTGDELREVEHFFDKAGTEVTERRYNQLPPSFRGETVVEYQPSVGWSGWTQPYLTAGDRITSPSLRKYLLLRAWLLSDDPGACATLSEIVVKFTEPVARQILAELWPVRVDRAGTRQEFSFYLAPEFAALDRGFDEILVYSPSGAEVEFLGIRTGTEREFLEGSAERVSSDRIEVVSTNRDSILVRLPRVIRRGDAELVEIRFETSVFLNGTPFEVLVGNSSLPGSWQWADYGEATRAVDSQTNVVSLPIDQRVIGDVEVAPNPFTPNGDGVNDRVMFRFSVFKVNARRAVRVTIYSLDGREIANIVERRKPASGRYNMEWSGEDASGTRVPPGIYVARIQVDVDSESAEGGVAHRLVCVAY